MGETEMGIREEEVVTVVGEEGMVGRDPAERIGLGWWWKTLERSRRRQGEEYRGRRQRRGTGQRRWWRKGENEG